ncbi:hypothetical protein SAY86_001078 [Trapa natans]|uniref:Superoxide dismutase copper chaperone n=1 Tax=Trapa natans TaxID=22666 RepID=A0AAN7MBF3_TRANT|nr:hypothetical protein SAY86_001078 [Trapa natans]
MEFPLLRTASSITLAATAAAPSSRLATWAFSSSCFSHPSNSSLFSKTQNLLFSTPSRTTRHFHPFMGSTSRHPAALHMEAPTSQQNDGVLPELLTEFMVDMKCEGCANAVKNKLQTVNGVTNIEVDLKNQVVRILGTSSVKVLTESLEQTGQKARLIGQGVPEDFLISAAVAEFKGPEIFGVVRFAQVSMELARIEANFSGLSAGKHAWSINEFGDLTRGAASTGNLFNPKIEGIVNTPLGDLGTLEADEKKEAIFTGVKQNLRVADLIGRSVVLYQTEDTSEAGIEAAVIARSAGVGENYKKLCTCDGTIIWESTSNDFVTAKF